MAIGQKPNVDAVLLASRVPYMPNLFVIGPYAVRVSFSSQQRRAMTLVWAIDEDLKRAGDPDGLKDKTVGVIGGGLAGLTAATAVAALEGKTWIFDKNDAVLGDMKDAKHREIHPTINFWPQEPIEPTTVLPFFNWYHDSCDKVAKSIIDEWNGILKFGEMLPRLNSPQGNCEITKLRPKNGKWILEGVKHPRPKDKPPKAVKLMQSEFDILILATGFGQEDLPGDTPSYWNAKDDRIAKIAGHTTLLGDNFVVSGTGDGGVIEVLRLLLSFQAGGIEPQTSAWLKQKDVQIAIKKIESAVQRRLLEAILHETFPVTDPTKDEISLLLWRSYSDFVKRYLTQQNFVRAVDAIRTTICKKAKVTLLGQRASPLEYTQSPYHKLFLTYAIHCGWVEYYQVIGTAKIRDCKKGASKFPQAREFGISHRVVKIKALCRYHKLGRSVAVKTLTGKARRSIPPLECCFYVGRHGSISPIKSLLKEVDEPPVRDLPADVRKRQSLYADQDWLSRDQAHVYAKALHRPDPMSRKAWAEGYAGMANIYFPERHGINVEVSSAAVPGDDDDENGKEVTYNLIKGPNYNEEKYWRTQAFIPEEFIGVKVVNPRFAVDLAKIRHGSGHE